MSSIKNFLRVKLRDYADKNTLAYTSPKENVGVLALRTFKYKIASAGLPITPNERFLRSLKDKHKGKRCFIIGNGPSLNKLDLTLLKDEYTFGFNSIFLNYDKMGFYPNYFIVEDVLVAEDRKNEINALKGPTKFYGNHIRYCMDEAPDTYWINVIVDYTDYPDFPHFSTDALRRLWVGGTVTYLGLQMAYYMGFSEVYMIGYDHSYAIPKTVTQVDTQITSNEDDPNHFHPDYFGKGYRWHDPKVDRMELCYHKSKKYFEADGRKVYNATAGGHLEVFDRVDYNTLFNKK